MTRKRSLETNRCGHQFYASGYDKQCNRRVEGVDIVDWRKGPIPADVYNPCKDQMELMEQMQLLLGGRVAQQNHKLAMLKAKTARAQARRLARRQKAVEGS